MTFIHWLIESCVVWFLTWLAIEIMCLPLLYVVGKTLWLRNRTR